MYKTYVYAYYDRRVKQPAKLGIGQFCFVVYGATFVLIGRTDIFTYLVRFSPLRQGDWAFYSRSYTIIGGGSQDSFLPVY